MIQDVKNAETLAEALTVMRHVVDQMGVPWSENEARQSIADMASVADRDRAALMQAIGRRFGIELRQTATSWSQIRTALDETLPVLIRLKADHESGTTYAAARTGEGGKRPVVVLAHGEQARLTHGWLKTHAARDDDGHFMWLHCGRRFPADEASAVDSRSGVRNPSPGPLRRFLALLRPERRDIITIIIFALFVGILSLTTPLAVEALVNTISFGRYLQPLIILSLIMFVFLAFRAGLGVLTSVVVEILQRRIFVRVVDDLSARLTRVPLSVLRHYHGPELVNRFFEVVSVQKITSKLLLESLLLILQTLIGLAVLAFYHPFLLGYDIGLIAMMTVVLYLIGRGAVRTANEESLHKYRTAAWLQEVVRHPSTFRFNGGMKYAMDRADELVASYVRSRSEHYRVLFRQILFSFSMQAVAATVLLGLGGYLVIQQQLTLGQLVAAELIVSVILGSLAKLGRDLESFYDLLASMGKLGKLLDLPVEPHVRQDVLPARTGPAGITLRGLQIPGRSQSPLTLSVLPGETMALYGGSGTGKSAMIEAMAGLGKPSAGYVLLDDLRVDLLGAGAVQSRVALVNEVGIFEGTVEENLRLGRVEVSSDDMNRIAGRLGMQEIISSLPEGMATPLQVSGYPLSSGYAIRLVLARAVLGRPALLLIDGLLDRLPDQELQEVLSELATFRSESTIVIATGRKVIADWAGQRILMDD